MTVGQVLRGAPQPGTSGGEPAGGAALPRAAGAVREGVGAFMDLAAVTRGLLIFRGLVRTS